MFPDESCRVRRARIGDEAALRDLRLRAMLDAPDAFESTYEREMARSISDWQKWLSPGVTFILEAGDGPKGIVAGGRDAADPNVVHLMAMWLDPALRGSGGADALAASVVSWAASEGARYVWKSCNRTAVQSGFTNELDFRRTAAKPLQNETDSARFE